MPAFDWIDAERLLVEDTTVKLDTVKASNTKMYYVVLSIEGASVRMSLNRTLDGITSEGTEAGSMLYRAGTKLQVDIHSDIQNIKLIRATSTNAVVHINYYGYGS